MGENIQRLMESFNESCVIWNKFISLVGTILAMFNRQVLVLFSQVNVTNLRFSEQYKFCVFIFYCFSAIEPYVRNANITV